LHDLGLVDLASLALGKEEPAQRNRLGKAAAELMCKAYGAIGTAEKRFAWSREGIGNLDLTQLPDGTTRWRWDCRFPQPYAGIVSELEKRWQLPPGLLYAVIRQESSFREKIRSPVGAVGLTQLLPKTAERLLKDFGALASCGDVSAPLLDEPRCNLGLGARYLHTLLEAFDNQLPLVVLSYNAGPEMVQRWLASKKTMALDLFLAAVPFAETRNYAHHVLTNFLVYRWLGPAERAQHTPRPGLPPVSMAPRGTSKALADLY
jgi:soluble lytic murein transglycosylase